MGKKISKQTVKIYVASIKGGEFIPKCLRSIFIHENDGNGQLLRESFKSYAPDGTETDSWNITRRFEDGFCYYERFDRDGNVMGFTKLDKEGREVEDTMMGHTLYEYESDKLIKAMYKNPEGHIYMTLHYEYDHQGSLVKIISEEEGKVSTRHFFYSMDHMGNKVVSAVDDNGRLTEYEACLKTSGILANVLTSSDELCEYEDVQHVTINDRDFNVLYQTSWRDDDVICDDRAYVFNDESGNCIMKITKAFGADDEFFIEVSEIEYYDDFGG